MEWNLHTTRVHYETKNNELGLEATLNDLKCKGYKILFVTSEYYGGNEVAYTIIYEESEVTQCK